MKKRIMAAFMVAVLVLSMSCTVFAGSKDANKTANNDDSSSSSSNNNNQTWWYTPKEYTLEEWFMAFSMWAAFNAPGQSIVGAGPNMGAVTTYTCALLTPGQTVTVFFNDEKGNVTAVTATVDANKTVTVSTPANAKGWSVGAAVKSA